MQSLTRQMEYILNYQSGWSGFLFTAEYHQHFNRLAQLDSRITLTIIQHRREQDFIQLARFLNQLKNMCQKFCIFARPVNAGSLNKLNMYISFLAFQVVPVHDSQTPHYDIFITPASSQLRAATSQLVSIFVILAPPRSHSSLEQRGPLSLDGICRDTELPLVGTLWHKREKFHHYEALDQ